MNDGFSTAFSDKDILLSLMKFFAGMSKNGISSMIPYASYLIWIFGIIDLCTTWYLFDGQLQFSKIIEKIIKVGAFYVLVTHWADIVSAIGKSFAWIGYIAGGHTPAEATKIAGTSISEKSIFNPSYVLQMGDNVTSNIAKGYAEAGDLAFGQIIMYGVCWLLVTLGFYFITLQLVLTHIEFAVFTCLAVILIPFGCFRYTDYLSNKAVSGVFSFGVKMMVMYFLLGIVASLGDNFNTAIAVSGAQAQDANGNTSNALLYSFMLKQSLAYITVGYLVWKLPDLAASMVSGQPSMGNGITPGTIAAGAGAIVGTTAAAVSNSVKAVKAGSEAGSNDNAEGGSSSGSTAAGAGGGASGENASGGAGAAAQATTLSQSNTGDTGTGAGARGGSSGSTSAGGSAASLGGSIKGAINSAKNTINSTPLLNRNATMSKISQYKGQFAIKDLAGKAGLVGKMLGLAAAQATIDTAKLAGNIGAGTAKAVLNQINPVASFRDAYSKGTGKMIPDRADSGWSQNNPNNPNNPLSYTHYQANDAYRAPEVNTQAASEPRSIESNDEWNRMSSSDSESNDSNRD